MLQLSATELSMEPVQGTYGCGKDCLCDSHSIKTVTDHLLHSLTTSDASLLSQTVALMLGSDPCLSSPISQEQIQSYSLSSFFVLLPLSYWVLHGSIYSFLVVRYSCLLSADVCKIFCIWRCIPDVSMETDVLHVHLLLCHHESLQIYTFLILLHFVLKYTEVQTRDYWYYQGQNPWKI